jgi:hypothetical protein
VFAERPPLLDAGALWFTGVLLIFSLGYAGAVRAGLLAVKTGTPAAGALRARHVVVIATAVAVSTFLVRLWLPAKASLPGDLHLWEWPQCLGLLALGLFGSRHGLLRTVPDTIRRGCGAAVPVALLSVPVVAVATGVHSVADSRRAGGIRRLPPAGAGAASVGTRRSTSDPFRTGQGTGRGRARRGGLVRARVAAGQPQAARPCPRSA